MGKLTIIPASFQEALWFAASVENYTLSKALHREPIRIDTADVKKCLRLTSKSNQKLYRLYFKEKPWDYIFLRNLPSGFPPSLVEDAPRFFILKSTFAGIFSKEGCMLMLFTPLVLLGMALLSQVLASSARLLVSFYWIPINSVSRSLVATVYLGVMAVYGLCFPPLVYWISSRKKPKPIRLQLGIQTLTFQLAACAGFGRIFIHYYSQP